MYFSSKLEAVHEQKDYHARLFAFQLIMQCAKKEFAEGRANAACRKYEEAYSCWRYYKQEKGGEEFGWREIVWRGASDAENEQVKSHMIQSLQNIVACNLKEQNYVDALPAANEVLRLDPENRVALIRRAKAISMPINASAADYEQAILDLEKLHASADSPE